MRFLALLVLLAGCGSGVPTGPAATQHTEAAALAPAGVSLSVHAPPSVGTGQTFDVALSVAQGLPFNGYQANLQYDPGVLEFVPLSPTTLQQGRLMTDPCGLTFHQFAQGAHQLGSLVVLLCANTSVTGPGDLYRMRFIARHAGATSLTLSSVEFANAGIEVLPVTTTGATVQVVALRSNCRKCETETVFDVAQRCAWCHSQANPPAGVHISTTIEPQDIQRTFDGLVSGKLPFTEALSRADEANLRTWLVGQGALAWEPRRPTAVRWIAADLSRTVPGAPLPGYAFTLEDGARSAEWTRGTRNGLPSVRVTLAHRPPGSPPVNPSGYWMPAETWHPWYYDARISLRMTTGRWSGPALLVRTLHAPGRASRSFVQLSVDRDAIAFIRTPTALETRPPRQEEADLRGVTYADGFYLSQSMPVDVVFWTERTSTGTRYRATVDLVSTGRRLATLDAVSSDRTEAGGWCLWKYGIGGPTEFWNIDFDASVEGGVLQERPAFEPATQTGT